MKHTYVIITCLCLAFQCSAYAQTDSISINLDEVVVKGVRQYAIDHGIAYTPSRSIKQQSMNVVDMLSKMMVAGLRVDVLSKRMQTTYGSNVHLFINGVEAQEEDIVALRTKEVLRVEYLQAPGDPQFLNYPAVVNFIIKKDTYGGYMLLDAGQGIVDNTGSYNAVAKINQGKWTYQASLNAYYRNADDIVTEKATSYVFSQSEVVNKFLDETSKQRQQTYAAVFKARYDAEKVNLSFSAGYRYNRMPEESASFSTRYKYADGREDVSAGTSDRSLRNATPYVRAYFNLSKLPHKARLYGGALLSYNHNTANSLYNSGLLESPLSNRTKEDAWLPNVWLTYSFPLYKRNYMSLSADWASEIYRTHYMGTDNSLQKLFNNYLYLRARYNHSFSKSWSAGALLEVPVNSYKINEEKSKTTPYINGSLTLNGRIGQKHSFFSKAQISQMNIVPNYYNTVVRQDNEIEGTKGNGDLKPQRYLSALFSYSWMPIGEFSLNTSVNWESILNDIIPYWHPVDRLMVKDMMNNGDYNTVSVTLTPSVSLFNNKLRLQSMLYYAREMHSGVLDLSFDNWGISPDVSCSMGKHFSVSAGYNKFLKGYMRGGSMLTKFSDNLRLALQYNSGNFSASATVNSLLRKNGWAKSWFDGEHIHDYQYLSRPWDGRFVQFNVRYSFDFGRKIKRGNDAGFEGNVKTGVLE